MNSLTWLCVYLLTHPSCQKSSSFVEYENNNSKRQLTELITIYKIMASLTFILKTKGNFMAKSYSKLHEWEPSSVNKIQNLGLIGFCSHL